MKFAIEDVVDSMKQAKADNEVVDAVVRRLQELEDELKKEKEKAERSKKKFVLLAAKTDAETTETPMWVIQVEEDFAHTDLVPTIEKVISAYKNNPRKKKEKIDSIGNALLYIPKKDFSAFGIHVKTQEPTIVVEVENQIG